MSQDFFPRTSDETRMSLDFFNLTLLYFISVKDLVCTINIKTFYFIVYSFVKHFE